MGHLGRIDDWIRRENIETRLALVRMIWWLMGILTLVGGFAVARWYAIPGMERLSLDNLPFWETFFETLFIWAVILCAFYLSFRFLKMAIERPK